VTLSDAASGQEPDASNEDTPARNVPSRTLRRHLVEWGVLLVLALVVTFGVRAYVAQTFFIPSGSMNPTLLQGDRIVVDKLSVRFGSIHRGDILVFRAPPTEHCSSEPAGDLVKRVIGLPGDRLYSIGNRIYVNGKRLHEAWPHTEPLGPPAIATKKHPVLVAAGHYYMMGDNHFYSCDSRYWGTITHSEIIGKAFVRIWPISRWGTL
jgi:signal peptidase I